MSELLEILMIASFGASWPISAVKAYRARSARGTSLAFLLLVFFGYVCGIASKFLSETYMASFAQKWYVLVFYVFNFVTVGINILLYLRNRRLDKAREAAKEGASA